MLESWDDWGERLGRMQSAACSPAVMHLLQSVCGLFCSQCLVLHVPWFDLAAKIAAGMGLGWNEADEKLPSLVSGLDQFSLYMLQCCAVAVNEKDLASA